MITLNKNCWFCDKFTRVSLFKTNSWTCSECKQYNGFTKDGDYNKEIPEMFARNRSTKEKQNYYTKTIVDRRRSNVLKDAISRNENVLCDTCNRNQEIKLNKLSNYESKNEDTYDFEIEMYKNYLDQLYDLCNICKSKVKFEIRKQDGILKQYLFKLGNYEYFFENNKKANASDEESDKTTRNDKKSLKLSNTLNIIMLLIVIFLLVEDNFHFNWSSSHLVFYILSYTISFLLILINNFDYKNVINTILSLITMYSTYLDLNLCSFVNPLVVFNIVIQLHGAMKSQEIKANDTFEIKQPTNDDLSKSFYKCDQSKSFINALNGQNNSYSVVEATRPPRNSSTFSLYDLRRADTPNSNICNVRSTFGTAHRTGSVLRPAKLNYLNKNDSGDSDFVDDFDNSSSIISGMTNLYLEKTRGSRSKFEPMVNEDNKSKLAIQPKQINLNNQYGNKANNGNIYVKAVLVRKEIKLLNQFIAGFKTSE